MPTMPNTIFAKFLPRWYLRFHRWVWWKLFYLAQRHGVNCPPVLDGDEVAQRRNIKIGWAGLFDDLVLILGRGRWTSSRRLDVMLADDPNDPDY